MSIHAERIITDPALFGGRPYIRGTSIPVQDVLDLLVSGYSDDDVLEELPELERADVHAVMDYRAQQRGTPGRSWSFTTSGRTRLSPSSPTPRGLREGGAGAEPFLPADR